MRTITSLRRCSSDHVIDAGRSASSCAGSYQLISAARAQAAASGRCRSITGRRRDRQADRRTHGHPTVTWTLAAYYAANVNNSVANAGINVC